MYNKYIIQESKIAHCLEVSFKSSVIQIELNHSIWMILKTLKRKRKAAIIIKT